MAIGFKTFKEALDRMPLFLTGGLDLLGQHYTIDDLCAEAEHEIDLATECEENVLTCKRQSDTTKRWQAIRAYIARCKASDMTLGQDGGHNEIIG